MSYYDYRSYLNTIIDWLEKIYNWLNSSSLDNVDAQLSSVVSDLSSLISTTDIVLKLLKWILIIILVKLFASFCRAR